MNEQALFAHFARRQGVAHYRPTTHDARRLAQLRQGGYTQPEIVAAIDSAFDHRSPDAPPIRMFAYCAAIALGSPPGAAAAPQPDPPPDTTPSRDAAAAPQPDSPPDTTSSRDTAAGRDTDSRPDSPPDTTPSRDTDSRPGPLPDATTGRDTAPDRDTASLRQHVLRLYQAEIGAVTPLVDQELRPLLAAYPERGQWDVAFSEAARANVRRLSYVQQVLKRRAAGPSPDSSLPGGSNVSRPPTDARRRGGRAPTAPRITDPSSPRFVPTTGPELLAAQQCAAAVKPLDIVAVLGTTHA